MDKKAKLFKAADRMARAYRKWVESVAAYNALLMPEHLETTYNINWKSLAGKAIKK